MDFSERGGSVKGSVARGMLVTVLVIAGVCGIAWWGIASRAKAMMDVARETRELAVPTVSVVRPGRQRPQDEVVLPGSMQAFVDAPIYARTSGYLRRRTVDIGAHVKMGQLLAEIDAPELGQQLEQARADLSTAEANARLAQITSPSRMSTTRRALLTRGTRRSIRRVITFSDSTSFRPSRRSTRPLTARLPCATPTSAR
jgi:multidrug efflux pump subunit AcrA (membrane-fusion protein)